MKPVAIGKPESNGEGVNADIGVKYLHETKSCTLEIVHLCNLAQLHSFNSFCHNARLFRCDTRLVLLAYAYWYIDVDPVPVVPPNPTQPSGAT